jgi:hypothetical protein
MAGKAAVMFSPAIMGTSGPFLKQPEFKGTQPLLRADPVQPLHREGMTMLGIIAAILFAIAFIINAANVAVSNAIFAPTSLMLLGLACLALHLSGFGTGWRLRR